MREARPIKLHVFSLFLGMHRKSQEAADALNNDDSCNSDRDDTQSKCSDISISTISNSKSKGKSGAASSVTPTSAATALTPTSTPSNHEASTRLMVTPTSSPASSITIGGGMPKVTSPSIATSTPPPHHLTTVESTTKTNGEISSLVNSTPLSHYHPDTDPEAFRWVDYNRDPISFIRCDIYHNYNLYWQLLTKKSNITSKIFSLYLFL